MTRAMQLTRTRGYEEREYASENDQLDGYWQPGCSGRSDAGVGETARRHHPALHRVRSDRHRFYLGEWRLDLPGEGISHKYRRSLGR
jgi:hypothetical protein